MADLIQIDADWFPPSCQYIHQPHSRMFALPLRALTSSCSFLRQKKLCKYPMITSRLLFGYKEDQSMSESNSEESLLSPAAFIAGLEHPSYYSTHCMPSAISKPKSERVGKTDPIQGTVWSEKSERKRIAGLKSRDKKRKELQQLEERVGELTFKIQQCDRDLSRCKDELVEAIKLSTHSSSEHAFTFTELQKLITSEDPDLDELNLLLDIIQSRLGANGKERQSKLDYNFKQIINSLFPAMHRYFMYAAVYHKDIFCEDQAQTSELQSEKWTKQLYEELHLNPFQIERMLEKQPLFAHKRSETIQLISKLKSIKSKIKCQEQIIQNAITNIREDMNPIHSSQLILFGEKNKLRSQFLFLDSVFVWEESPSKRTKLQ